MYSRSNDIRRLVAWIAAVMGAVLAIYLLMAPPVIGVADSGDFIRVMGITGFQQWDPNEPYSRLYFAYAHSLFGYGWSWGGGYVTTQLLLFALTGLIARIFNGQAFDVRWLGAVYILLFSCAVYLCVRYFPAIRNHKLFTAAAASFLGGLLLFIFGDVGYLAYFQSFFGEPYALTGMLFAIASAFALASKEQPSAGLLALFIAASVAVATSKTQNAPLGFAFALLAWRMISLRSDRRWRRQAATGAGILLLTSILMIVAAPKELRDINLYQSVFYGVLKDSPHPAADMRELGIPEKYAANAGTNYFQKNTAIPQTDPVLRLEVLHKLGHRQIALYYFRHPARFLEKLRKVAANGVFIRPHYLGNYDQSAGKRPGAVTHSYSVWSDWKTDRMPHTTGWLGGFYLMYFAVAAALWLRTSSFRMRLGIEALAVVGVAGIFAAVVPIIGDGEADLGKHLFMFNVCFDMMVVSAGSAVVYVILRFAARRWAS